MAIVMNNFYKILEVDPAASSEVIEKAYKTLAKKYHPDRHTGDAEAWNERMRVINEAYAVLSNPRKRKFYDEIFASSFDVWLEDGLVGVLKKWLLIQKISDGP